MAESSWLDNTSQDFKDTLFKMALEGNEEIVRRITSNPECTDEECLMLAGHLFSKLERSHFLKDHPKADPDHIYLIKQIGTNLVKIGISCKPEGRAKMLNCGNPSSLELIFCKKVPNARLLEARLHEEFASDRKHGEWFELPEQALIRLKQLIG